MKCNECGYDGEGLMAKITETLARLDVMLWEYQVAFGDN